ncbi:MAG TPA: P-II family nitrogen regulator [Firmicutes bacterium]|nr:P-II family nitrogen regulator [Bacillota bacterium]
MKSNAACNLPELIVVIVNFGMGSKIIRHAKQHGITGATVVLGKGIVKKPLLEFLELHETRKEIVLMGVAAGKAEPVMAALMEKFQFQKPHHGIAFSIPIVSILGTKLLTDAQVQEEREVEVSVYQAIFVIVDKGNAELVIDAAKKAGARGGTIINARGSGIHETAKLFAMEIEPEKEIVLIIADKNLTDAITTAVRNDLEIDKPGKGIVFVQNISRAYGLR